MKAPLSSLNLLRTFECAARHLSFTAAANELCITASAVSQQIRRLEQELGLPLFERRPRELRLTRAGRQYWQTIRPHLEALDAATTELGGRPARPLRISLMPPLASRVVFPALADFQQQHPALELRIDASLGYLDLARQETDLAIRFGNPPWPGCEHEKLLDLYVLPVCPPAMAEQYQLAEHPENLRQLPLIQMTERPDSWQRFFDIAGLGEPKPQQQFFVDDYPAAIEAAETLGAALAVVPLEQPLLDSKRLAAPWPAVGPLPEAVYAVYRKEDAGRADIAAFLDWLRTQLGRMTLRH